MCSYYKYNRLGSRLVDFKEFSGVASNLLINIFNSSRNSVELTNITQFLVESSLYDPNL